MLPSRRARLKKHPRRMAANTVVERRWRPRSSLEADLPHTREKRLINDEHPTAKSTNTYSRSRVFI